ncbi:MAG: glutaredoxin family protein [Armatimonadetes bacterium]|nr:glutaredoxin family protein [Armatimonadota bacterium]
MARQVVFYSLPGCEECERAKEFLEQEGIPFLERSIVCNSQALAELRQLGALTLSTFLVDGEPILGFDRRRLAAALAGVEPSLSDTSPEEETVEHVGHGGI